MEETKNQEEITVISDRKQKPWLFKKGESGNPAGRPKGSKSLKTWVKEYLANMTDDQREEFLNKLSPELIWRMGEGNPAQDLTSGGEKINPVPIYGGLSVTNQGHDSHEEDISVEKKD